VTTGGSTREVMDVVRGMGARVLAVGSLVDRSGGTIDLGVPRTSLLMLEVPTYAAEACPACATARSRRSRARRAEVRRRRTAGMRMRWPSTASPWRMTGPTSGAGRRSARTGAAPCRASSKGRCRGWPAARGWRWRARGGPTPSARPRPGGLLRAAAGAGPGGPHPGPERPPARGRARCSRRRARRPGSTHAGAATGKLYRYVLDAGPVQLPRAGALPPTFRLPSTRTACGRRARLVLGRHDFSSLASAGSSVKTTERTVRRSGGPSSDDDTLNLRGRGGRIPRRMGAKPGGRAHRRRPASWTTAPSARPWRPATAGPGRPGRRPRPHSRPRRLPSRVAPVLP